MQARRAARGMSFRKRRRFRSPVPQGRQRARESGGGRTARDWVRRACPLVGLPAVPALRAHPGAVAAGLPPGGNTLIKLIYPACGNMKVRASIGVWHSACWDVLKKFKYWVAHSRSLPPRFAPPFAPNPCSRGRCPIGEYGAPPFRPARAAAKANGAGPHDAHVAPPRRQRRWALRRQETSIRRSSARRSPSWPGKPGRFPRTWDGRCGSRCSRRVPTRRWSAGAYPRRS